MAEATLHAETGQCHQLSWVLTSIHIQVSCFNDSSLYSYTLDVLKVVLEKVLFHVRYCSYVLSVLDVTKIVDCSLTSYGLDVSILVAIKADYLVHEARKNVQSFMYQTMSFGLGEM